MPGATGDHLKRRTDEADLPSGGDRDRDWDWNWDLFQPLALSLGSFVDGSMQYQDGPGLTKGSLTGLFLQP